MLLETVGILGEVLMVVALFALRRPRSSTKGDTKDNVSPLPDTMEVQPDSHGCVTIAGLGWKEQWSWLRWLVRKTCWENYGNDDIVSENHGRSRANLAVDGLLRALDRPPRWTLLDERAARHTRYLTSFHAFQRLCGQTGS